MTIDYLLEENPESYIKIKLEDEELLKQFKAAEKLPEKDKAVVKELLNAFLLKNQIQMMIKKVMTISL